MTLSSLDQAAGADRGVAPPATAGIVTDPPIALTGRHVRLVPLTQQALPGLWQAAQPEPAALVRWFPVPFTNKDALSAWIDVALADWRAGVALPFATVARGSGQVVGSTRFGHIDRDHRRVEIGWTWLGRPWQRTAFNTEAKRLMLGHAFEVWGCVRVELRTDRLNQQSRAAIARLGAREEGILRKHIVCGDGRLRDTVVYAILEEDWPVVRARLDARLAAGDASGPGAGECAPSKTVRTR